MRLRVSPLPWHSEIQAIYSQALQRTIGLAWEIQFVEDPFESVESFATGPDWEAFGMAGSFSRTNSQVCVVSLSKCTRQLATS
jgi:hypothetical protein